MFAYWFLLSLFAFAALHENYKIKIKTSFFNLGISLYFWVFILTLFIGFRHNVSTDWFPYLRLFAKISELSLREVFTNISYSENISYSLLLWLSSKINVGIYGANLCLGFIFSLSLIIFCNNFPRPYLGLLISFPFIVIVVGMGYGRQGVALAFLMIALLNLFNNKKFIFALMILVGSTFHQSLIIFLPFLVLSFNYNKFAFILLSIALFPIIYIFYFQNYFLEMINLYIVTNYESKGALIRLILNLIPSFFFILFINEFKINNIEKNTWLIFSILNIILFILYFFVTGSAALDRISIYLTPIQILVFTYLPEILSKKRYLSKLIVFSIVLLYVTILYVWIFFSNNSVNWIPYKNILLTI